MMPIRKLINSIKTNIICCIIFPDKIVLKWLWLLYIKYLQYVQNRPKCFIFPTNPWGKSGYFHYPYFSPWRIRNWGWLSNFPKVIEPVSGEAALKFRVPTLNTLVPCYPPMNTLSFPSQLFFVIPFSTW